MTVEVFVRRGATIIGEVVGYTKLIYTETPHSATGGGLTVPQDDPAVELLLTASTEVDPVGLLVIDRDAEDRQAVLHVVREKLKGSGGEITIPLLMDQALINEVPAFPDPTDPADPWGAAEHWTTTGSAATATAAFLAAQVGPAAHADWERFDQVDTIGTGATISYRARMQPCLDVIRDTAGPLVAVDVHINASHQLVVTARETEHRLGSVFSAETNTMLDWEWDNQQPAANVFFTGGTGEGTARELTIATLDEDLWPRKRGVFLDRNNLTGADLEKAATEQAVWAGPTFTIDLDAAAGLDGTRYGVDWLVGDWVAAEVVGRRFMVQATSVTTEISRAGVSRKATLGADTFDGRPELQIKRAFMARFGLEETA